jgi:hypothetical protein
VYRERLLASSWEARKTEALKRANTGRGSSSLHGRVRGPARDDHKTGFEDIKAYVRHCVAVGVVYADGLHAFRKKLLRRDGQRFREPLRWENGRSITFDDRSKARLT